MKENKLGKGAIVLEIAGERVETKLKFEGLTKAQMALVLANLELIKNKIQRKFEQSIQSVEND